MLARQTTGKKRTAAKKQSVGKCTEESEDSSFIVAERKVFTQTQGGALRPKTYL